MECKYIVLRDLSPVVFPVHMEHSFVSRCLGGAVSGGKFNIYPASSDSVVSQISLVHGSVSMGVKRDESDEKRDSMLIERLLKPRY